MKKRTVWILIGIAILLVMGAWFGWRWSQLVQHVDLPESSALPPFQEGDLASITAQLGHGEPGESGFFPIDLLHDALSWRLALIDSAEQSLDLQYYLWHSDKTGGLLIDRLLKAADRGVRVRILVDDMTVKNDKSVAILDEHSNIDIRIFNPSLQRSSMIGRLVEMVLNLGRLNHRMHNKLLVADNLAGIVGGRNIGDEYFGLSDEKLNFRDFDLLAVGPLVPEISSSFDLYWNSDLALPPSAIRSVKTSPDDLPKLQAEISQKLQAVDVLTAEGWLAPKNWTDELTGLLNRKTFHAFVDTELARRTRSGAELCFCLCDIDHFKKVNDSYGHPVGDIVLKAIAARLKNTLRSYDVIWRWGGEEFLIMCPDSTLEVGAGVAERLRATIEQPSVQIDELALNVTMSFGITTIQQGEDIVSCLKRCDRLLYLAKEHGRNRVVSDRENFISERAVPISRAGSSAKRETHFSFGRGSERTSFLHDETRWLATGCSSWAKWSPSSEALAPIDAGRKPQTGRDVLYSTS